MKTVRRAKGRVRRERGEGIEEEVHTEADDWMVFGSLPDGAEDVDKGEMVMENIVSRLAGLCCYD